MFTGSRVVLRASVLSGRSRIEKLRSVVLTWIVVFLLSAVLHMSLMMVLPV